MARDPPEPENSSEHGSAGEHRANLARRRDTCSCKALEYRHDSRTRNKPHKGHIKGPWITAVQPGRSLRGSTATTVFESHCCHAYWSLKQAISPRKARDANSSCPGPMRGMQCIHLSPSNNAGRLNQSVRQNSVRMWIPDEISSQRTRLALISLGKLPVMSFIWEGKGVPALYRQRHRGATASTSLGLTHARHALCDSNAFERAVTSRPHKEWALLYAMQVARLGGWLSAVRCCATLQFLAFILAVPCCHLLRGWITSLATRV